MGLQDCLVVSLRCKLTENRASQPHIHPSAIAAALGPVRLVLRELTSELKASGLGLCLSCLIIVAFPSQLHRAHFIIPISAVKMANIDDEPTTLTREFIDQQAPAFHRAFSIKSHFNKASSRYQPKELS